MPECDTLSALLRRVAGSLERLPYTTWNFGDSIAFEGLLAAGDTLDDERYSSFARGMVRGWATRRHPIVRLDCTAPGKAMVDLVRRYDDELIAEAARELADYLRSRPMLDGVYATWEHSPLRTPCGPEALSPAEADLLADPPPGVFVDCLHFDPPFFAALGTTTGSDELVDEAVGQALGYVRLLQRADGLFQHFVLAGSEQTYGPEWGRGQGWAMLGLLDVLTEIDGAHPGRDELATAAVRLVEAMIATQRPDGAWYAVVGSPASGDEHSTAAFMAVGFVRAVELGLFVADRRDRVLAAARSALVATTAALDDMGTLTSVSAAVNACTTASHYVHVSRGHLVPWGQGPAALALATHLRLGAAEPPLASTSVRPR